MSSAPGSLQPYFEEALLSASDEELHNFFAELPLAARRRLIAVLAEVDAASAQHFLDTNRLDDDADLADLQWPSDPDRPSERQPSPAPSESSSDVELGRFRPPGRTCWRSCVWGSASSAWSPSSSSLQEILAADRAVWQSVHALMRDQSWTLSDSLNEIAFCRQDMSSALQPRPRVQHQPQPSPTGGQKRKRRSGGGQGGNNPKLSRPPPPPRSRCLQQRHSISPGSKR